MLNVIFGRENAPSEYRLDNRYYFTHHKKPEWFEDDFVKEFLLGVDGTTVLFEEALKDKFGHGISTEMISTGCKSLCCIYFDGDKVPFNGSQLGRNCIQYYMEVARQKDITLVYESYPRIEKRYFSDGLVSINGVSISEYDFEDAYLYWCEVRERKLEEGEVDGEH